MSAPFDESMLDDPAWHALGGPQQALAELGRGGVARRYPQDVCLFGAVDDGADEVWEAVDELVGPGGFLALMRRDAPRLPARYREVFRTAVWQLVAGELAPIDRPADLVVLGADDVPDMAALVDHARPGPFEARTHELGRYVGVRRDGRLVAMAGERMHVPGAVEISAVCTDESVRGEGLGAALTIEVARGIAARGELPFLHVEATNTGALGLYRRLGFEDRMQGVVVVANRDTDPA